MVGRVKAHKILEIGPGVRPCEATYQKVEIFDILGPRSHPREPIGMKFHVAKRTHVPCQISRELVQRVAPAGRKCWFLAHE